MKGSACKTRTKSWINANEFLAIQISEMRSKRKDENNPQRLAKNLPADQRRSRPRRARKNSLRAKSGGHARGAVADERDLSPLIRLVGALRAEKIRFQLISGHATGIHSTKQSGGDAG